jgi:hypothetical protein
MRSERGRQAGRGVALGAVALLIVAGPGLHSLALDARPPDRDAASEYEVKAVFIHHLMRYLQWPRAEASGASRSPSSGRAPSWRPCSDRAKATIRERRIAIRPIADVESLGEPEVLFVAKPAGPRLAHVLRTTRGRPILTIAEEEGLAARGMAVNFVLRGESVKFEINEGALRASGIEPGSQLLRLAILVKGQP